MSLLKRESLLTVGGLLLLAGAYYFVIYRPGRVEIAQARRGVLVAEQAVREIPQKVKGLESLKQEIERRRVFLTSAQTAIPQESDVHAIVGEVTQLANNAKLKIDRLEPSSQVIHNIYTVVPFNTVLTGRFSGLSTFLAGLETHPRLFRVDQLSITPKEGGDGESERIDIHFAVYALRGGKSDFVNNPESSAKAGADSRIR